MLLYFLKAAVPLTKSFERLPDKTIQKTPYPHVYNVTSIEESCPDLKTFEQLLLKHAALGHCLVKGILSRPLNNESRKGTTSTMDETEWICLDIDGLAGIASVDQLLDELGLSGISYIVQFSASYGVENKNLRCHVYILLDRKYAAPTLKQWLIALNLNTPVLSSALRLTRTGNTLYWPLDISTCQNDKLIYIATPRFKNLKDPLPKGRIQLVRKARAKLSLASFVPNAARNKAQTQKKIDALRTEAGLPKRKEVYKTVGTIEYMAKPDIATITEMKSERGFTYFNLNGGDSWAYYHPDNNPEFIYNFKNEPTYLTKELLPDYWKEANQRLKQQQEKANAASHGGAQTTTTGLIRLAFCDAKSSTYFRGYYDPATDHLELNPAKSEKQVRDFAKQYNMPLGDYIPEWNYTFDPHSSIRIDPVNRIINTFQPSVYMRTAPKPTRQCPRTIYKVIHHALGSDQRCTNHFLNWVAFILQKKTRTRTAWIMQGTQGTGKGILMNRILRPLFGEAHTTIRRMEEFNEQYNHFMQQMFIIFVDEVQTRVLNNEKGVIAKIKNFIPEPTVTIRRMFAGAFEAPNFTNWIFASNQPDPVSIDKEDRRFNVGTYQPNKLVITEAEIQRIEKELQAFHDYLAQLQVDELAASTPLDTEDRQTLISISENSVDTVAGAIMNGNFEFFLDQLPTSDRIQAADRMNQIDEYKTTLVHVIDRTQKNGKCAIARDELRTLFDYNCGNMPVSPNKFTSYLKHHRLHMSKVWIDARAVAGIYTVWKDHKKFPTYRKQLTPTPMRKTA